MLNKEQKEAVSITEGPVLVIAGAGTGKTKTITERILKLIKNGINPRNILAITFTNKAAKEMRDRVTSEIQTDKALNFLVSSYELPFISTFHSLGVKIIRENSDKLNLKKNFGIADKEDSRKILKEAIKSAGFNPKDFDPNKISSVISTQKSNLNTLNTSKESNAVSEIIYKIWSAYEKIKEKEKVLDFDDLILKPVFLFEKEKSVLDKYKNLWQYIHIDEYQDTNKAQYRMAKLLSEEKNNIYAVGDIDQSIYSWRNADIKNLLNFEKDFKNTKVVILKENYRSSKTILGAANSVIRQNKERIEKELVTNNLQGEKLSLFIASNGTEEAYWVANKIKALIERGAQPKEIAVLFRTNFQSRAIEEAFLTFDLSYEIWGTRFFERKEIKDLISFFRLSMEPESVYDLKRVINIPPRGIGPASLLKIIENKEEKLPLKTREKIKEFRNFLEKIKDKFQQTNISETLKFIIKESGMEKMYKEDEEERFLNIQELVSFSRRYDNLSKDIALEKFFTDSALLGDKDETSNEEKNSVKVMTVHAAKGLEFDYVFITGLEDGLFPHINSSEGDKSKKEEERRLFYVALTRARKKVYLSYAAERNIYGSREVNMPSEFISEIDNEFVEREYFADISSKNPGAETDYTEIIEY